MCARQLYYKARIDSASQVGTAGECYSLTFTDYGNSQDGTHVALVVPYPESLLELAAAAKEANDAADAELAEMEKPLADPEEPKKPSKGITGTQVIGTNADGTPQYMSIEVRCWSGLCVVEPRDFVSNLVATVGAQDEARLKILRKKDKQERKEQRKEKARPGHCYAVWRNSDLYAQVMTALYKLKI